MTHRITTVSLVATRAHERDQLERLCRYIARPAVSTKRLSLTRHGKVRYELKTPYSDGTTHVIFEPLEFIRHILVPNPCGATFGRANRLSCRFVIARLAALDCRDAGGRAMPGAIAEKTR